MPWVDDAKPDLVKTEVRKGVGSCGGMRGTSGKSCHATHPAYASCEWRHINAQTSDASREHELGRSVAAIFARQRQGSGCSGRTQQASSRPNGEYTTDGV
eukprot:6188033-Pleurochrysis_carterae.AAC.3